MSLDIKQNLGQGQQPFRIVDSKKIQAIEIKAENPSLIHLYGGESHTSSCIHCPDQPCISYAENDFDAELSSKFKVDSSKAVCATFAIKWDYENSQPVINSEDCVLCGVCVSRCPTRAIYLSAVGAKLAQPVQNLFISDSIERHLSTRSILSLTQTHGAILNESDDLVTNMLERFKHVSGRAAKLAPNLLIRNLYRTLGVPAEAYPQGVQYSTVDVLFRVGDIFGAVEVELTSAVIDVPRNLAGDVAVLIARHGLIKNKLETHSIVLRLPQGREQYWMVVYDMEKVIGIRIRTISVLALFLLTWAGVKLNVQNDHLLLSEKNGVSLRPFLIEVLGKKINLAFGLENQLEPSKLVE